MGKRTINWGFENEERFFHAFSGELQDMPPWFVSVRRAVRREDRQGFDAFMVTTDVGEIPIQIKSSARGVVRFFQKWPRHPAVVVLVRIGSKPEVIQQKVFAVVERRRAELLKEQEIS